MTDLLVTDELRNYLIVQGVGVAGDQATVNELPTIWLQPKDGPFPPRVRDGQRLEQVTITLNDDARTTKTFGAEYVEETVVSITVRAVQHSAAILTQRKIYNLLVGDRPGGRQLWTMNTLLVQYSVRFNGDQFVATDEDGYQRNQRILLGCRLKSLAGLSYAPGA